MRSAFLLAASLALSPAAEFPPPGPFPNPDQRGAGLQRTLSLLATSTPDNRHPVRILFYGQSITEQKWTKLVEKDLRKRFPHADLTVENRAIGGHSSQLLVKTAEADLYPFYPDLVIFHVYGDHRRYEDIIRRIRERTTAEVLIQSDHLNANADPAEETDPARLTPANWEQWFNYGFLPEIAAKYRVELAPQRDDWKRYLRQHDLLPKDLLKDNVHLNEHGEFLMAEIVKSHLRHHPDQPPVGPEMVRTVPIKLTGSTVEIPFTGNRVDAVMAANGMPAELEMLVDGRPPSEFRSTTVFGKVSGYRGTHWPCLLRVQRGSADLQEETWTIRISEANEDYTGFQFTLSGSLTGPDGGGRADAKFVSNSGRIVIEPGDWNLAFCLKVFKQRLDPDAEITFETKRLSHDRTTANPGDGRVTLVQGIPNGDHVLTLRVAEGEVSPVSSLVIHHPPFPATEDPAPDASAGER